MNSNPLVSSIIIFFNAEQFFEEAIESVFAQTYDHWELLLADDGSTDSSTTIARRYAQQYPEKVRYLEHEGHQNQGMSATRNLGIRHAKGEYIAFLDADDIWLPHKLEQQVKIMESKPEAGMLYGRSLYWYSWTNNPEDAQRDYIPSGYVEPDTLYNPPALLTFAYPLGEAVPPPPTNILLRRKIVEQIGGFEPGFHTIYQLYEDQAFFAKMYLHAPVFVSDQHWDNYRIHPSSCCSLATRGGYANKARLFYLNWLKKYLTNQNINDSQIQRALRKAFFFHPLLDRLYKRYRFYSISMMKRANSLKEDINNSLQTTLPVRIYINLKLLLSARPLVGWINFGTLRRITPISREFGYDRGLPIDRYYIHRFLETHQTEIQGRVLEIGESTYTRQFGGDRVTHSDVLHVIAGNPEATFVGDLTKADHIPSDVFDCIILTQTLHLIYDMKAAVATLYRTLKPGGVLLATVPGISQVVKCDWGDDWCWSLTTQSARLLLEEYFPQSSVEVEAYGNVLTAAAFLYGAATEDLRPHELEHRDPEYQCLITLRAVKPGAGYET